MFNKNIIDKLNLSLLDESMECDYTLMCLQMEKIVNRISVTRELHSDKFWQHLKEEYNISGDENISMKADISYSEKNRESRMYKYTVKLNQGIYMTFFDETRNIKEEEWHDYATDDDKSNKITNLIIYYDPDFISSLDIEKKFIKKIEDFIYIPSRKNQFFMISFGQMGYHLSSSYIKKMDINIKLNYGDKFEKVHNKIITSLKENKNGLYLFNGSSGCGKTSYLRKLISELSDDKIIIYVPPFMMQNIVDPEFVEFITRFRNSILVLDDSEVILSDSDYSRQAVNNILNLTDGLLNDAINVQIIATYNSKFKKSIDPGLKRYGRLVIDYEFKKLSIIEANRLSEYIKIGKKFDKQVSLAEIYKGYDQILEKDDMDEVTTIGFRIGGK
jgi:hypothetical protein